MRDGGVAGAPAVASPVTAAGLAHVRLVAAGLVLLVTSSLTALGVTLVMPVGPVSLPALNVPAPKIHAAALVQRTIGGQPGPWGVAGTTAALTGVIGLWLLTTPRSLRADAESALSARRLARWSGVLSAGAVLGILLSGVDPYVAPRGDYSFKLILLALAFCELPANAFLYHYLYRLSLEMDDRRAAGVLDRCRWLVPVLTGVAVAVVVYSLLHGDGMRTAQWPTSARVAMALYGAAAVAVGAAATAAVLGLLGTCAARACAGWLERAGDAAGRFPALVRAARAVVARDPRRWAVAVGIVGWLLAFAHVSYFSAAYGARYWVHRGQLPLLDFVGPKVFVTPLAGALSMRYEGYETRNEMLRLALASLAVVWLMTWRAPAGAGPRGPRFVAGAARWSAVLVGGLMMGVAVWADGIEGRPFRHPRMVAGVISAGDAVTTVLIYLHLANVAFAAGQAALGRRLRVLGMIAAALGMAPIGWLLEFPSGYRVGPDSLVLLAVCASQVAGMLAVTFLCAAALGRLAWALVAGGGSRRPVVSVEIPALNRPLKRVTGPG